MKQTKSLVWYAFMLHKGMMYSDDEKVIKLDDLKEIIKNCGRYNCPVKELLKKSMKDVSDGSFGIPKKIKELNLQESNWWKRLFTTKSSEKTRLYKKLKL